LNRRKNTDPPFKAMFLFLGALLFVGFFKFFLQKNSQQPPTSETTHDIGESFAHTDADPELKASKQGQSTQASMATNVSTTTLPSALPPSTDELFQFLNKADPKAHWTLTKNAAQRITSISGGVFKLPLGSIKSKAELAAHLAGLTGVSAQQISSSELTLPETGFSRTVQFQQSYEGYKVDQAFVRLTERKADGGIFFAQLEAIPLGEPDLRINTKSEEAQSLVLSRYSERKAEVLQAAKTPVVFVTSPEKSELAWTVIIKLAAPTYDERHLTVGASSGQILQDVSALQN